MSNPLTWSYFCYYEISVKVIRMPEKSSWGVKGAKCVGFLIRMALMVWSSCQKIHEGCTDRHLTHPYNLNPFWVWADFFVLMHV